MFELGLCRLFILVSMLRTAAACPSRSEHAAAFLVAERGRKRVANRQIRRSVHSRDVLSTFQKNKMGETSHQLLRSLTTSMQSKKDSAEKYLLTDDYYSDDCFGLIFLSTGLIAHDVLFAGFFLILSILAASAFNSKFFQNILEQRRKLKMQLPAVVAGATLLLVSLIRNTIVTGISLQFSKEFATIFETETFNIPLEVAVCLISLIYGFASSQKNQM